MMLEGATHTQYDERQGLIDLLATDLIQDRGIAIDGGAHVGTWTEIFAAEFRQVHAFESGPAWPYLVENMGGVGNVVCHHAALSDVIEPMTSFHRRHTGKMTSYRVRPDPEGDIEAVTIDSLELPECSMIKLDIEGYEYKALIGAEQTIEKYQPFLLVEMCGHGKHAGSSDRAVRELIEIKFGYRQVWHWGVDFGFAPEFPNRGIL